MKQIYLRCVHYYSTWTPNHLVGWVTSFGIFQDVAQGYVCTLGSRRLQLCLRANPEPETPSSAEEDALRLVLREQSSYRDQSIPVTLCHGYLKSGLAWDLFLPVDMPLGLDISHLPLGACLTSPRHSRNQQWEMYLWRLWSLTISYNALGQFKPNGLSQPVPQIQLFLCAQLSWLTPKNAAPWEACITTQSFQTPLSAKP